MYFSVYFIEGYVALVISENLGNWEANFGDYVSLEEINT